MRVDFFTGNLSHTKELVLMKMASIRILTGCIALFLVLGLVSPASAQNLTLRIVCYNIEDDITNSTFQTNATTPLPGLIFPYAGGSITNGGVLEGLGEEILADGVAQPVDILALEETTSNPTTIAPIVAGLNAFYSQYNPLASNMYAMSTYQATEEDGDTGDGNGPNALVYNTKTVQLLASVPVDPPGGTSKLGSSSGEYREVMRYEFAPANQVATAAAEFYIYVSHYKSGGTTTDTNDRSGEAIIIRNDETNLPANARVIYVGDFNMTGSFEPGYQTIAAATSPGGVAQGQGIDPFSPSGANNIDWSQNSLLNEKTEEDYSLHYRDDYQLCTSNVYYGASNGLALVQTTYHAFGNNGTTAYENSVNNGTDTALNSDLVPGSLISASQLLLDLIGASDHLPVVADYTIPGPVPAATFTYSLTTNADNTEGVAPLTVSFTSIVSSGIVTNWLWDFGDGTTSNTYTSLSVSHTYTNAGVYSVRQTVSGPGGTNIYTVPNLYTVLTPYQAWQLQYFGCTNCAQAQPTFDADGTGQNNAFKFVAGLNPTNPASVFVFTIAAATNQSGAQSLVFSPAVSGRIYAPQFNTNLASGTWLPLTNFSGPVTNGSQVTITDTNSTLSAKYYRINISYP
jgi:PKD repeat protein